MNQFHESIKKACIHKQDAEGKSYLSLSTSSVISIANNSGLSSREVEIDALQWGAVPERYQRNIGTIGIDGQIKLLNSSVAVVGAGGLGGSVIEMLARIGVGQIHVIDMDVFTDSNLNRQILCNINNLNVAKVDVAVKRVTDINPSVEVVPYAVELDERNIGEMIEGCQIVVDALDNIQTRRILETKSKEMGIPFIHGAVAGFLGQVMTIFPEDEGLVCVYGDENNEALGIEVKLGVPGITPFLIASLQVSEVIKVLLGWPKQLRDRLLIMDLKKTALDVVELE
jgi:molybdopterin/thiamine biosynthesis adenylyltransferase